VRLERLEAPAFAPVRPPTDSALGPASDRTDAHVVTSVGEAEAPHRADRVAGFLCAFSLALSGIAMVRNPALLATAAILVAFVAVVMTKAHRTLAAVSVAVGGVAFLLGMVVAVLTDSALY
jgi:hypothetical protein